MTIGQIEMDKKALYWQCLLTNVYRCVGDGYICQQMHKLYISKCGLRTKGDYCPEILGLTLGVICGNYFLSSLLGEKNPFSAVH